VGARKRVSSQLTGRKVCEGEVVELLEELLRNPGLLHPLGIVKDRREERQLRIRKTTSEDGSSDAVCAMQNTSHEEVSCVECLAMKKKAVTGLWSPPTVVHSKNRL
jgi:hypothetical protein